MTWKLGMAIALSGFFLTSPALAQSGSTGGSTDMNKPGQTKSMEQADRQVGSGAANGRMASQEQVKSVQEALKDKGYDPGQIDGAMGPRTSSALRDFQQAEGLQATGRLDAETRSKLGI
ncbi:MAG: peptidoglycan-binding domain-containing protein [Candidatus Rokuibacteriota bacterium]